jgi:hypothetical protein
MDPAPPPRADPAGTDLAGFLAEQTARPAPEPIRAAAQVLAQRLGDAVVAILFYGSCRRTGDWRDGIVDLYLLVDSYRAAYRNPLTALANRLLPPNVSYAEVPVEGGVVRFKYGVVSLPEFARRARPTTLHPAIWGRFAQPVGLLWARDPAVQARVVAALADAARTLIGETLPLLPARVTAEAVWSRALAESYRAEFRAEDAVATGRRLYHADSAFYDAVAGLVLARDPAAPDNFRNPAAQAEARDRAERRWRRRRRIGKPLSLARLVKAAFTFRGGVDYLLWKIERHSGVALAATDWQRRHPLLSGPVLAWRLYRRGGFR